MSENRYLLKVEKIISATPEMVFDAWLDQGNIGKWLMPGDGITVPNPVIDAKVGGQFSLAMQVGDNLLPHTGEYKKINRPNELQFTWNSPHGTNGTDSIVTIQFEATGEGSTKVTLQHELLPTEAQRDDHNGGWERILNCLNDFSAK